jgi:cell division cycle 2-like protein
VSDFDVPRRELAYTNGGYDRVRNGNRDYDRSRIRQRDVKERELMNGGSYHRSASSRSHSGSSGSSASPKRPGYSVRVLDREPGELSSESGSDEAFDSTTQVKHIDHLMPENGAPSTSESTKKRKFSPIVWDRDDKEVNTLSKSRMSPAITTLPPPPPLPRSSSQPINIIQISLEEDTDIQPSEPPVAIPPIDMTSQAAVDLESPPDLSPTSLPEQQPGDYNQELDHPSYEDSAPIRNIRASRWANDGHSPIDEGEIARSPVDTKMQKKRKRMAISNSVEMKQMPSPETGKREGSEGARARSLESIEGNHAKSGGRDNYLDDDDDFDRDDYMEIDGDNNHGTTSVSLSDEESDDDGNYRQTPEPALPLQRSVDMLQGCRSVDEFERLNKIDEGTYGVVYRAKDKKTGEVVALKKVKMEKEKEGFPLTALREINILLSFDHPSIVDVKEVVVGSSLDSIFMVMEYMEHDLKALMETMKQPFSQSEVKCLMLQLLEGTKYLHDNWVLHRDLKTSNLLLNNRGELKICDFGLARQYGSPLKPYTHLVVTLWYRAPELLLGAKQYSTAIDMWSLGCIMAELLSKEPLFNGKTEFDQLDKIFRILGTPDETIWPGFSKLPGVKVNFVKHQYNLLRRKFPATSFTTAPVLSDAGFDLLNKLLTYDPEKRITAEAALKHEWFKEVPLPKSKDFMPTFPAQHAQDRRMRRVMKSPDPLEEQRRKELRQAEVGTGGLFG